MRAFYDDEMKKQKEQPKDHCRYGTVALIVRTREMRPNSDGEMNEKMNEGAAR